MTKILSVQHKSDHMTGNNTLKNIWIINIHRLTNFGDQFKRELQKGARGTCEAAPNPQ